MNFGIGVRQFWLTLAIVALAGCSEWGVQHVEQPSRIQVSPDHVTLFMPNEAGDEEAFPSSALPTVTVLDAQGQAMTGEVAALRWDSSAPGVATIDAQGRISAIATGSATIRWVSVVESKRLATMSVTVLDAGGASVTVR